METPAQEGMLDLLAEAQEPLATPEAAEGEVAVASESEPAAPSESGPEETFVLSGNQP
jgi:hypothetical protein